MVRTPERIIVYLLRISLTQSLLVIGVGFFGDQSSIPWLAALVTDASSHTLLSGHIKGKRMTSLRFNDEERQELRRRALIIAFYLLRSPLYDRFTK